MAPPVIAFLAFTSGSYEGAIIRDMRLANALRRRGFEVVVYWMMERNPDLVDAGIVQRTLCRGLRYRFKKPLGVLDALAAPLFSLPARMRREFIQRHPKFADTVLTNFCRSISGEVDAGVVSRLIRFMQKDGVTHLLPTFAMTCPLALAAKRRNQHPFEYLVTFQGEEIFANYAQRAGMLKEYCQRLREVVDGSAWPAVAVSRDYINRLHEEMDLDPQKMRAIYPGIELPTRPPPPFETLHQKFDQLVPGVPIVSYIGRQDSEKGIDLLLYAAKMLLNKGLKFQLVVCGGTSFGQHYRDVIKDITQHLRIPIQHRRRVPGDVRDAIYAHSRVIVYPSIHREPFGMVAAEAMSHGAVPIVPNLGGITEVVNVDGRAGGLTFAPWDSGDLARVMEQALTDEELYQRLKANTRDLAALFTVDRMTDKVLEHLGLA